MIYNSIGKGLCWDNFYQIAETFLAWNWIHDKLPNTGCLKKTEFSGYAGRDGCDGPMEGGRGLKKLYLIFIYKYTNTICSNTQTHSNTPTNTVWIWGKMKKSKFLKISFKLSL